jgi:hypothetical protein
MTGIGPCIGVVKIQAEEQSGILDADGKRYGIRLVVSVVVRIGGRLGRAARPQPQPHAVEPVIFEYLNAILDLAGVFIDDTARFKKGEVREISRGEKIRLRLCREDAYHGGDGQKNKNA